MSQSKRRRSEMNQGHSGPEEELKKLSLEVEPITMKRTDQPPMLGYRPTYRAVLARKGYLVRNSLGSGSYSKVKMALDFTGCSDKVAVKIIDRLKAPRDYQDRFLPRELDIWPKLNHPNIISLHECFQDSRRVYMILEYSEGGDVLRYIQNSGALSENMARMWTLQIADAVRYMHDMDVTHRDLKLENLLLDSDRNIKICDFGFIKGESTKDLSQTYCGSKSYAAPEILLGRPYDPRKSDIWALGVILYIFVTGKMPFDETKGTKSILEEQRVLDFHWPKMRKISTTCKNLIKNMFTWDYEQRPDIHAVLAEQWFHGPGSSGKNAQQSRETLACSPKTSGSIGLPETVVQVPFAQ